jgi:Tol biopolymer transport system component
VSIAPLVARRVLHVPWIALVLALSPLPPHGRKLNGPLARLVRTDVTDSQLSSDGTRAVYLADRDQDDVFELYARALLPGAPALRLNASLPFGGDVRAGFRIDAQDRWVVFLASNSIFEGRDLFVAPVDASTPPRRINDPVLAHRSVDFFGLTRDYKTVVYVAAQVRGPDVWVVPLDGSLPPRRITSAIRGRDPIGLSLTLDPQDEHVLFEVHFGNSFGRDLFRAPLDGSAPPQRVTPDSPTQGFVQSWSFTPRGDAVVFLGDFETRGRTELFATFFDPQATAVPRLR